MCGRYVRRSEKQEIATRMRLKETPDFPLPTDFNVSPQTFQPIIKLNHETGDPEMVLMQWGMTANWVKPEDVKKARKPINARNDNLTSGLWRTPYQRYHGLAPFDLFYEWPDKDSIAPGQIRIPQVYEIKASDDVMPCFPAIYDRWYASDGTVLESYATITAEHNELLAELPHPRSPVILYTRRQQQEWLDFDPQRPPDHLLVPPPSDIMQTWKVSPKLNNSGRGASHGVELIEPLREEPVAEQRGLFS